MLGLRYLKTTPTTHLMLFRNGKVVRQGAGLSFFYYAPTSEVVQIPLASVDVPFVFNEVTSDFQQATIQGDLTYHITEPEKVAKLLDFSVDAAGRYKSDDPTKLNDRLVHAAQVAARAFTQQMQLTHLLSRSDELVSAVQKQVEQNPTLAMLGLEVLSVSILSIKAEPEMTKAMQAESREKLLQKADQAMHERRNMAIELERAIKENELETEIKVEEKRRLVRETQLAAEIAVEEKRSQLVDTRIANEKKESQARAEALAAMMEPLKSVDWKTLLAAAPGGIDAKTMVALAFRDMADNAEKIGTMNISPDLLAALLQRNEIE